MANSSVIGLLRVLLSANTAEFQSAMKSAAGSAKAWSGDLKKIGAEAQQVGLALTKTLTLPLLAVGAGLIKVGKDFDIAKDSIRAATGATGKDLDALDASFKRVLATVPNSLEDVAKAIGDISTRTGATGDRLESLATQMLNLARVSKSDLGSIIAATTRAFGDWSISVDKQSGALDFLFKTSQQTGIGVTKLTELVVQFGAPLRALGFEFEEAAAMMGKWEQEGVNLETVLSGLRFALGNFAAAGKEPAAALREVQEAIKNAGSEAEANDIAFKNFGRRAGVDMARAIIEGRFSVDELVASLKASKETINSAAEDTKSLGEKFLELKNRVMVAVEPLATSLVNALEKGADMAMPLIKGIELLAKAFGALPGVIQGGVVTMGLIVAATGPVVWIFGQLVSSAGVLIGAFAKKGLASRALATDLTLTGNAATVTASKLTLLGKAASVAAAFFVGWQIGRLIADLTGLDQKIADSITRMGELQKLRVEAAKGGSAGQEAVTARLAELQEKYNAAMLRGNEAEAGHIRQTMERIKTDQTFLAIQDTKNKAISLGADSTINYADAVKFVAQKEAERLAGLKATQDEQQRTTGSTQALTDKMDGLAAKLKQADAEIAQLSTTAREKLVAAIKSGAFSMKDLEAASGLSEFAIKRLEDRLKSSAKATKEHAKSVTEAEKAAEKHAKALEKQLDALDKLGLVTENQVLKALGEFNELVTLATAAGVPLDNVLAALLPRLEELQKKAKASGIEMQQFGTLTKEASDALIRLNQKSIQEVIRGLPAVRNGLEGLPPIIGELVTVSSAADIEARNLTDSFKFFGISTRAELLNTARAAVLHYNTIKASGKATPEEIQKAFEHMAKALEAVGIKLSTSWTVRFKQLAADVRQLLSQLGGDIASILGSSIRSGDWSQFENQLKDALAEFMGSAMAKGVDMLVPGLGTMLKPLLTAISDKILGAFGMGTKGRDLVKGFAESMGGFDSLRKELNKLGAEGERLWIRLTQGVGRNNPKEAAAAITAIEKALANAATRTATFNTTLGSLLGRIRDLGSGLPDSLRKYLEGLRDAGKLTEANIALLAELTGRETDWKKIAEAVARYGGNIEEIGGSFQKARLHDEWQQLIDDMALFEEGGIAAHDILNLTKGKIIELAQQSLKFKTEIPENMRPWIQTLIDSGELLDASGEKITDINQLTFGETLQTSIQLLTETIKLLIEQFDRIAGAVGRIPRRVDVEVNYVEGARPRPISDQSVEQPTIPEGAATGGMITAFGLARHFGAGGKLTPSMSVFGSPRGADNIPLWGKPGEIILNESQQENIGDTFRAAIAMGRMQSQGGAVMSDSAIGGVRHIGGSTVLQPIDLVVDGRQFGRVVVPVVPGEARRLGVRVRT